MTPDPIFSPPLFSIITPVHNGGVYFEELIQSIASQSETSVEHIVIDDGSNDSITRATLQKYPYIKWWSRENRGQYFSMNEGLEKAVGHWVCFISADDMVAPGALSKVKSIITEDSSLVMVWGKGCHVREDGSIYEVQNILQRFITFINIFHMSRILLFM
jgi:glycosyltransferase involved in cell wall biosynthesis